MKITFVRPNMTPGFAEDALEPLVFALLSGLTPPDVERVLYDERVEPVPTDEPTDLVAITVETFTARRAYQLAAEYHRRGVPVVLGGFHPTLLPAEALRFAGSIVVGDAEGVWPQVIEDARRGELKRVYERRPPSLAGLAVDRAILAKREYGPLRLVQVGRGCRFACDFCSIRAFYGDDRRQRPVADVIAELERLAPRYVFFTDDNLFLDPASSRALFEALVPLKLRWLCQISLDVTRQPELLELMERSGCLSATVGFESLIEENLKQMHKPWNTSFGRYEELVQRLHDHGIMIYGTFVFGYDHDTTDAFDISLEFALRSRLFLANFNPLTPTPGTPLYDRLAEEGRLLYDPWWLDPAYRYGQSMFRPARMTPDELTEGCYRARTEFNRYANIGRRSLETANRSSLASAQAFLAANLISRREIHRKQGLPLGAEAAPVPLFEAP